MDPYMPLIASARSVQDLVRIVREHSAGFSALHDSSVCVNAGRMGLSKEGREVAIEVFLDRASSWLARDGAIYGRGARNAANVLHACAKLGLGDHAIAAQLAEEASRHAPQRVIKPQEVANCMWAMAKMGIKDRNVLEPMAACAVRLSAAPTFNCAFDTLLLPTPLFPPPLCPTVASAAAPLSLLSLCRSVALSSSPLTGGFIVSPLFLSISARRL